MGPWEHYSWVLALAALGAWAVGMGTGSNSFGLWGGAAVASRSLSYRRALVLGMVCEGLGAFFLGSRAGPSIRLSTASWQAFLPMPEALMYGLCCQLAVTGLWLLLCSRLSLPVSATNTAVSSTVGMALVLASDSLNWAPNDSRFPFIGGLASVLLSMLIAPVLGALFGAALFLVLRTNVLRSGNAFHKAIWVLPSCICLTLSLELFFIFYKLAAFAGRAALQVTIACAIGCVVAVSFAVWLAPKMQCIVDYNLTKGVKQGHHDQDMLFAMDVDVDARYQLHRRMMRTCKGLADRLDHDIHAEMERDADVAAAHHNAESFDAAAEECFKGLQVLTSGCLALAHGATEAQNITGSLATVYSIYQTRTVAASSHAPAWIAAIAALGMASGGLWLAHNNMTTLGVRIARISPSRGFAIQLSAIGVIVLATICQMPMSTPLIVVSSTVGVAILDGSTHINKRALRTIALGWLANLVAAGVLTAAFVAQAVYAPSLPNLQSVAIYKRGLAAGLASMASVLPNATVKAQAAALASLQAVDPAVSVAYLQTAVSATLSTMQTLQSSTAAACAASTAAAQAGASWWTAATGSGT